MNIWRLCLLSNSSCKHNYMVILKSQTYNEKRIKQGCNTLKHNVVIYLWRRESWKFWLWSYISKCLVKCEALCKGKGVYIYIQHVLLFRLQLSVQFSRSVMSNSLRPHEPQLTRPPCPSPTPGVYSNSIATHSSILAQRILWTVEPGGLLSIGSHRVRHN